MTEKQRFHITDTFLFYEQVILKYSQDKDDYVKYYMGVTRKEKRGR